MIDNMPDLEKMSTEEKNWFASAIAGMIVADGHTDKKEIDSLRDAINFLESKSEIDKIMDIVKKGQQPNLKKLDIDSDQSFLILRYLIILMAVDSVCSEKEIKFLFKIGKQLRFSEYENDNNVIPSKVATKGAVASPSTGQKTMFKQAMPSEDGNEDEDDEDMEYEL